MHLMLFIFLILLIIYLGVDAKQEKLIKEHPIPVIILVLTTFSKMNINSKQRPILNINNISKDE